MSLVDKSGHGGDIYSLADDLKVARRNIIDFSVSTNPLGVSNKVKAALRKNLKFLDRYPDTSCRSLKKLISLKSEIPVDNILIGNGSTELIYLIIRALKPTRVLLLAPTFSEYESALTMYSHNECALLFLIQKSEEGFAINVKEYMEQMEGCTMAFLCNPNSPTATFLEKNEVLKIANHAREIGCVLVVDEAFVDFLPEISIKNEVACNPYLIVLHSLTKFYALSGLRIGAMYFHNRFQEAFNAQKEPWSVNILAEVAGIAALKDKQYIRRTFEFLKLEKSYIEKKLKKLGIYYYPSKTNYYLLKDDRSPQFYEQLRQRGILVRDCSNYRGLSSEYLRIAVKGRKENAALFRNMQYSI